MGIRKPEFTVTDKTVAYAVVTTYHSLLIPQNVEHLMKIYSSFQASCLGDWCSAYLPLLPAFPFALPMEGRVVGYPASTEHRRALSCPAFLPWWCLINHFLTLGLAKFPPAWCHLSVPVAALAEGGQGQGVLSMGCLSSWLCFAAGWVHRRRQLACPPHGASIGKRFECTHGRQIWWGGQWCWGISTGEKWEWTSSLTTKANRSIKNVIV